MAVEIVMPRLSDSMEEGTIVQWLVAEGDAVTAGAPLVEVETDKATVTYEAEHDGTILKLTATEGQSVEVGAVIAAIGSADERLDRNTAATARVKASPLARRVADSLGIDLATLVGSGPQGRVIRADVERAEVERAEVERAAGDPQPDGITATGAPPVGRMVETGGAKGSVAVRQLTRLQQTVVRRMAESRSTVPDFELRNEYDMSAVVAMREQLQATIDQPVSYNDFIVKAVALALREFPRMNGAYRDGAVETYERVNVGIAVATEDTLVVPTIFDADVRSLGAIAASSREIAARVREGTITPAELGGSTFTVSNLGMFGIDSFSAVIDAPQAAILAVGALKPRPIVAEDGLTLVARPTIQVSLACDHRILNGADAARFLRRLGELLAAPLSLLL